MPSMRSLANRYGLDELRLGRSPCVALGLRRGHCARWIESTANDGDDVVSARCSTPPHCLAAKPAGFGRGPNFTVAVPQIGELLASMWQTSHQIWQTSLGRFGSNVGRIGPACAKIGPQFANFGPSVCLPKLSRIGQPLPQDDPFWDLARVRRHIGHICRWNRPHRPNLGPGTDIAQMREGEREREWHSERARMTACERESERASEHVRDEDITH